MGMYIECHMNKRSYIEQRKMCDCCDKLVLKEDLYKVDDGMVCAYCHQELTTNA